METEAPGTRPRERNWMGQSIPEPEPLLPPDLQSKDHLARPSSRKQLVTVACLLSVTLAIGMVPLSFAPVVDPHRHPIGARVTRKLCYPQRFAPHGRLYTDHLPVRLMDAFLAAGYRTNSPLEVSFILSIAMAEASWTGDKNLTEQYSHDLKPEFLSCRFPDTRETSPVVMLPGQTLLYTNIVVGCPLPPKAQTLVESQGLAVVDLVFTSARGSGAMDSVVACLNRPIPRAGMQVDEWLKMEMPSRYLSTAVMVRDNRMELIEWLEYNLLQGFEYFYVYTNENDGGATETFLEEYIAEGVLEVIPWPFYFPKCRFDKWQWPQIQHALWRHREHTVWLSHHDTDEYLWPREQNATMRNILQQREASDLLALQFCWSAFTPDVDAEGAPRDVGIGMVTERNTVTTGQTTPELFFCKSIGYTAHVVTAFHHFPMAGRGRLEKGTPLAVARHYKDHAVRSSRAVLTKNTEMGERYPELRERWERRRARLRDPITNRSIYLNLNDLAGKFM